MRNNYDCRLLRSVRIYRGLAATYRPAASAEVGPGPSSQLSRQLRSLNGLSSISGRQACDYPTSVLPSATNNCCQTGLLLAHVVEKMSRRKQPRPRSVKGKKV
ncbi:hypothetical protein PoB_000571600 [Plakobranchus ocellatus]|uniref:Uncharacterized protein n=1 Tax=Plakobranchus ocellatus TaxID=259542 RepID=A0AAV3Y9Y6_9GAST|nr:hypothetical protein PoB_000571600 [Plakobranchus ocellatus]